VYSRATLFFVMFFHFRKASVVLTCSGSFMSHSFVSRVSLVITVSSVASALPSFLSWKA